MPALIRYFCINKTMNFGDKLFVFSGFLIGIIKGLHTLVRGDAPCTCIRLVQIIKTKLIHIFINQNRSHYSQQFCQQDMNLFIPKVWRFVFQDSPNSWSPFSLSCWLWKYFACPLRPCPFFFSHLKKRWLTGKSSGGYSGWNKTVYPNLFNVWSHICANTKVGTGMGKKLYAVVLWKKDLKIVDA